MVVSPLIPAAVLAILQIDSAIVGEAYFFMRLCILIALAVAGCATSSIVRPAAPAGRSVIILVWDGLRPDSVTEVDTPNLLALRRAGVELADHHSTFPTFTMMNAASLATGAFPEATGYYGNVLWQPAASGADFAGKPLDFRQPVFSEDRLRLAGTELPLFEPPTVEAIYQASSGLLRKANALAHHALFAAAIAKAKSITTEHLQVAMQEVA
jgi:hypothetical protein